MGIIPMPVTDGHPYAMQKRAAGHAPSKDPADLEERALLWFREVKIHIHCVCAIATPPSLLLKHTFPPSPT